MMSDNKMKILERWFGNLNQEIGKIRTDMASKEDLKEGISAIRQEMVTKQQFENRFQALLSSMVNLHERVESYKDQTDTEIQIIKRALRDLDGEVKQIRERLH